MAIGRCATRRLRAHGHCINRPTGHKQPSERTRNWIKLGGKVIIFASGFGQDTISDFGAGAGVADIISLSLGTAFDSYAEVMAATSQVGADTIITIDGANQLTLTGVLASALVADNFAFT